MGYSISTDYYGGDRVKLVETGQGNKFSGDMYRDISCLIIRQLEKKNFGVNVESAVSNSKEQCTSVAFVDDIDLVEEGLEAATQMQEMIVEYDNLYSATRGHIQINKTKFFSWQQKWKQGLRVVEKVPIELKVNE